MMFSSLRECSIHVSHFYYFDPKHDWLVVWLPFFAFSHFVGLLSSSQWTNSIIFQDGVALAHQPENMMSSWSSFWDPKIPMAVDELKAEGAQGRGPWLSHSILGLLHHGIKTAVEWWISFFCLFKKSVETNENKTCFIYIYMTLCDYMLILTTFEGWVHSFEIFCYWGYLTWYQERGIPFERNLGSAIWWCCIEMWNIGHPKLLDVSKFALDSFL